MVTFNLADLSFILTQIKIAEAHSAGTPLTDLVTNPLLPFGLRTVNGEYNNLIPGRQYNGAADQPFPRLTDPSYRTGTADPSFDINGPFAPGGTGHGADYSYVGSPGHVVDTAPRIISNLIVDQTLGNPAAVAAAIDHAGLLTGAAAAAARDTIVSLHVSLPALAQALADAQAAAPGLANTLMAYGQAATAADTLEALANDVDTLTSTLAAELVTGAADGADAGALAAADGAVTALLGQIDVVLAALQQVTVPPTNIDPADITAVQSLRSTVATLDSVLSLINVGDGDISATDDGIANLVELSSNGLGTLAAGLNTQLDNALVAAGSGTDVATAQANLDAANLALDTALTDAGVEVNAQGSVVLPNVAPDEGISAPFNSWFTLFGQFFDHGLDLVEKTATTKVYIPLQPDDPLYVPGGHSNFMVITRTEADARNITTPLVDQNQTYTSHASHQVFLRDYDGAPGSAVANGHLLEGSAGGLATWADVKAQALSSLGLVLDDMHVHEVPLLATDLYGMFERSPTGFAMVMVTVNLTGGGTLMAKASGNAGGLDLRNITAADLVSDSLPPGFDLGTVASVVAQGTGHAFLDDIAHNAAPGTMFDPGAPGGPEFQVQADADGDTGNFIPMDYRGRKMAYDDELLDRHFITGDGRGNENIGLTTVHHVFHSEHNRLAEQTKDVVLADAIAKFNAATTPAEEDAAIAFLNEWLAVDVTAASFDPLAATTANLTWDGERIFQAARFGTEMQYQHLVFEEFARKVNPMVDLFIFNPTMDLNPAIFAEFAHTIYRFGHSMLTETVDRLGADGQTTDDIGLIEAFLNPVEFNSLNGVDVSADVGAGAVVRAMTRQVGQEIDEFIVEALRNNLLGLPLDLAAVNIARGRETGMPTLQEARAQFYAEARSEWLKPYESWVDFAQHLKNPTSVINFIAAYGNHSDLTDPSIDTLVEKRAVATAIVLGTPIDYIDELGNPQTALPPADRLDFLNGTGIYGGTTDPTLGGLNNVDLWIGGLAEAILPFGGMLGPTFTFVFEKQMEILQNGDRFYYLSRTQGTHFLQELENNAFSKIIMKNTDLGADGATHLPGEIFSTPQHILEVNIGLQTDYNGADAGKDPVHEDQILQALEAKVLRATNVVVDGDTYQNKLKFTGGEHVVLGGTNQDDILIADLGDDTLWGDGGNDLIIGGHGINRLHGGADDDIIYGGGDPEFLHGDEGNDVISGGNGLGDLIFAGSGHDFVIAGIDGKEVFAGEGNDFILGTPDVDVLLGGEGDDWIEGAEGFDGISGENSELFFNSPIIGHDVMFAGTNETDFDAESGDDIMVQGESVDRSEGMFGFDWGIFKGMALDGHADLGIPIFTTVAADILRDRFDRVEALSGWDNDDTLIGDDRGSTTTVFLPNVPLDEATLVGDELTADGADRIEGMNELLGIEQAVIDAMAGNATVFNGGNVLIGGGGSDTIIGKGGNDIIDGDAWLNVRIKIVNSAGEEIGTADRMQGAVSFHTADEAAALGVGYAAAGALLEAQEGRPLDALMFERKLNPGQLEIQREILNSTTATTDIDVAVYQDVRANYLIEGESTVGGISDQDGDGLISIQHRFVDAAGDFVNGRDGFDKVRNLEALQFVDQVILLDPFLGNERPTGELNITITNGTAAFNLPGRLETGDTLTVDLGSVADIDGLPPLSEFLFTWQVEASPGNWVNIEDPVTGALFTGLTFTPTPNLEINDQNIRVVGAYRDNEGVPEVVFSEVVGPLLSSAPIVPDPAAVLGDVITEVDGVPVLPPDNIGIIEDSGGFLITREMLVASATDIDTPLADLQVMDFVIRLRDGAVASDIGTFSSVVQDSVTGAFISAIFTPAPDFFGGITFEYRVSDGTAFALAEANLEVFGVNDIPQFQTTFLGLIEAGGPPTLTFTEAQLFGNILRDADGNPTDVDGDAVQIRPNSVVLDPNALPPDDPNDVAGLGTLVDNGNGTWTFTPAAGFSGEVPIHFQVEDGTVVVNMQTTLVVGVNSSVATPLAGTINGTLANDVIVGDGGNNIINLDVNNGRDFVDGGAGTDLVQIFGDDSAEAFRVITAAAAASESIAILNASTEIVILRNGVVMAELDNIEEIHIDGGTGGDTVSVEGSFTVTSLNLSTVTIDGSAGNDTIDITGLLSEHRIVFRSGGGNDTIIGELRPQDVIEVTGDPTTYTTTHDNDQTIISNGTHTITMDGTVSPQIDEDDDNMAPLAPALVVLAASNEDVWRTITEAELLAGSSDLEGNTLHVVGLKIESGEGTLVDNGDGTWTYKPATDDETSVTFEYHVSDGDEDSGKVTATLDLLPVDEPVGLTKYGTNGKNTLYGGAGSDAVYGLGNNDKIYGLDGHDRLYGNQGNDTVFGGDGNDLVGGGYGNDRLYGEDGNDLLRGSYGRDQLLGGDGDDRLVGGAGRDVSTGGAGNDRFEYWAASETGNSASTRDVITDFEGAGVAGGDIIDLSAIDAIAGGANDAFVFKGTGAIDGLGQVNVRFEGGNTIVSGNISGGLGSDFQIEIKGIVTLSADDFAL